jgi:hypothetical protein
MAASMTKSPAGGEVEQTQPFLHSFLALDCRVGIIGLLAVMSMAVYL